MQWWGAMIWRQGEEPTLLSRYTEANGVFYVFMGALMFAAPALPFAIFGLVAQGRELAMFRIVGMMLAIIGWFYVIGARTNKDSFALATFLDRVVVPVALLGVYLFDQIELYLVLPFIVLDPILGTGALILWMRGHGQKFPQHG